MSYIDNILKLQEIHKLIEKQATGKADDFAIKVGVKHTTMFRKLDELRSMGAIIKFDDKLNTYYYENNFHISVQISYK
jgi:predicted transcriptional regulator